jgi:hypothetical protein
MEVSHQFVQREIRERIPVYDCDDVSGTTLQAENQTQAFLDVLH